MTVIQEEDWGWFVDIEKEELELELEKKIDNYNDDNDNDNIKNTKYNDFMGRQIYYISSICIYILSLLVS